MTFFWLTRSRLISLSLSLCPFHPSVLKRNHYPVLPSPSVHIHIGCRVLLSTDTINALSSKSARNNGDQAGIGSLGLKSHCVVQISRLLLGNQTFSYSNSTIEMLLNELCTKYSTERKQLLDNNGFFAVICMVKDAYCRKGVDCNDIPA